MHTRALVSRAQDHRRRFLHSQWVLREHDLFAAEAFRNRYLNIKNQSNREEKYAELWDDFLSHANKVLDKSGLELVIMENNVWLKPHIDTDPRWENLPCPK